MRRMITRLSAAFAISIVPMAASADLLIAFKEGAPTDRFTITNQSSCATGPAVLVIELAQSAGKLIFDTTDAGAGVDVFQPVTLIGGDGVVEAVSSVTDGDTKIELRLTDLPPGVSVAFTADLDDQNVNSDLGQTRVTGAEIAGAIVALRLNAAVATGRFVDDATAKTPLPPCVS